MLFSLEFFWGSFFFFFFATGAHEHSTVSLCLGRQELGGRPVPQEREGKEEERGEFLQLFQYVTKVIQIPG